VHGDIATAQAEGCCTELHGGHGGGHLTNRTKVEGARMWIYRGRSGEAVVHAWCHQRLKDSTLPHRREVIDGDFYTTHVVVAGDHHSRTVVLLPGRHSNAATLLELITVLAQRYRIVAVDLPGEAGLSSGGRPNTDRLRDYGRWIDAALPRLSEDPVVLLGHGFGAAVALAATPTPGVAGLVLLSPSGLVMPSLTGAVPFAGAGWRLRPTTHRSARLLSRLVGPAHEPAPELVEWVRLVGRHVRCSSTPPPDTDLARRWRSTPRTVATGAHDVVFPPSRLEEATSNMLDTPLVVVPAAGHLLPLERPAAVLALLARHDPDARTDRRMAQTCVRSIRQGAGHGRPPARQHQTEWRAAADAPLGAGGGHAR
jgi:pimeloyl-ACP methyl ester carboxylesterase